MTLLTTTTVAQFLRERGFPDTVGEPPVELGGGMSDIVLAVRSGGRELVLKQALPHLRVAAPWAAKRERALTEAAALSLARRLTPDSAPRVFDLDEERYALVIERDQEADLLGEGEPSCAPAGDPAAELTRMTVFEIPQPSDSTRAVGSAGGPALARHGKSGIARELEPAHYERDSTPLRQPLSPS